MTDPEVTIKVFVSEAEPDGSRDVIATAKGLGGATAGPSEMTLGPDDTADVTYKGTLELPPGIDPDDITVKMETDR